ncbi:MAG TPA: elongation factor P [Candidatus Omnitrophota bacterium]|nr:elongation factor P [Candidatus Omnitrophota bacterium]
MDISINDMQTGIGIRIDGNIFLVEECKHVKPGKGSAFLRTRLRNIKTQQVLERTFRSSETIEEIDLEEKKLQNLYQSGDQFYFMDMTNFEEIAVPKDIIGDQARFLQDHLQVTAVCHGHDILMVSLPTFIISEITHTEPGFKGDTANNVTKSATLDTGTEIQVPIFVNIGDKVKVDTRTGNYVERVKQ